MVDVVLGFIGKVALGLFKYVNSLLSALGQLYNNAQPFISMKVRQEISLDYSNDLNKSIGYMDLSFVIDKPQVIV